MSMRQLSLFTRGSTAVTGFAYSCMWRSLSSMNVKAKSRCVGASTSPEVIQVLLSTDEVPLAPATAVGVNGCENVGECPAPPASPRDQTRTRSQANPVDSLISMAVALQENSRGFTPNDRKIVEEREAQKITDEVASCPATSVVVDHVRLLRAFRAYVRSEGILAELCRSRKAVVRLHYEKVRSRRRRLPAVHRDILMSEVDRVVEQRMVPLTEVTKLLRLHWPAHLMDLSGSHHHSFLQRSVRSWVAELLRDGELSPEGAREVLSQCPRLFHGHLSLMSSIVECALVDINTIQDPEPIIVLMWSVNNAGTHAPHHFWRRVVGRLSQLNRSLRVSLGDAMQFGKSENDLGGEACMSKNTNKGIKSNGDNKGSNTNTGKISCAVGHVFSGLTTRQLFRTLRVLRKECWCGDVSTVYDFVDKALKNIAFEVEAVGSCENSSGKRPVSHQMVVQRVKKSADLTPKELLSLLSIAGELGVDFRASLSRTSDFLLTPMVRYLNREELLQLTLFVRKTRCDSLLLVQSIADEIVRRGVNYPLSLSLSKAALRTALQKPLLLSQLTLTPLVDHVMSLCRAHGRCMRASQLLGWVEVLYDLSRRYAASSSVGVNVRACVDTLAAPLRAMLAAGVAPIPLVSRFVELTVVLGMRGKPLQYPESIKLWEERNAAVNTRMAFVRNVMRKEIDTLIPMAELLHDSADFDDYCNADGMNALPVAELCRAARDVYDDLIYMLEMQAIMHLPLTFKEEERITTTFSHVGLYNIVVGASAMWQVHLQPSSVNDASVRGAAQETLPLIGSTAVRRALPPWMEQRINRTLEGRFRHAKICANSTDEEVLRLFGQRRCNAAKVHHFIHLLMGGSSLLLLKEQRFVWLFAVELARRFGEEKEQKIAQAMLARAAG